MFSIVIYNGLKLLSKVIFTFILFFCFLKLKSLKPYHLPWGFLVLLERLQKVGNIELWVILAYGNLVTLNEILILNKLKIGVQT
jgi:hypothetical protein